MLIVEHDLDFVFRVVRDVSVLHLGALLMTGSAAEVRASEEVARLPRRRVGRRPLPRRGGVMRCSRSPDSWPDTGSARSARRRPRGARTWRGRDPGPQRRRQTTLVHAIIGLARPRAGSVRIDGTEFAGRRPDVLARAGVALVPQGWRVFATAPRSRASRARRGVLPAAGPWSRERVLELFPRLGERLHHPARHLSGGEQQMLAVRAR